MGILAWIVLGGIAGWIASIIMGTDGSQGVIANVIVGVIGAFVGGFLFSLFGEVGVTGFNLYSLLVSVIGAAVLLWIYRLVTRST
jgi:uncharacterized membrane protein YeaQ/YmgE (transglycosylase-associated protein family)